MKTNVWLVYKEFHSEEKKMIILGIYNNVSEAIERVNKEFCATKDAFSKKWGDTAKCENNFKGRADLVGHNGYNIDVCVIEARCYEINEQTYDNVWSSVGGTNTMLGNFN